MNDKKHILKKNRLGDNISFCTMPWIGFAGDTDGSFRLCCLDLESRENQSLGNIQSMSIDNYRGSKALSKIRKKMLEGKKISNCKDCYKRESLGLKSKRLQSFKKYYSYLDEIINSTDINTGETSFNFLYLDIRFSNICNLACRMCYSRYSSGRIEMDKMLGYSDDFGLISGKWSIEKFRESPVFLSHIQTISIAGGEPFLDRDQELFTDFLISEGISSRIHIKYNTNLTNISEKKLKKLKFFHSSHITISCDGYGEVYEYIRIGSKWKNFLKNIIFLYKLSHSPEYNMSISIHTVVQRDNIMNIPKLLLFLEKIGHINIKITILTTPESLFIGNIELEKREKIIRIYEQYLSKYKESLTKRTGELEKIIRILEISQPQEVFVREYYYKTGIIDTFLD